LTLKFKLWQTTTEIKIKTEVLVPEINLTVLKVVHKVVHNLDHKVVLRADLNVDLKVWVAKVKVQVVHKVVLRAVLRAATWVLVLLQDKELRVAIRDAVEALVLAIQELLVPVAEMMKVECKPHEICNKKLLQKTIAIKPCTLCRA
jgi:hypothetical protein